MRTFRIQTPAEREELLLVCKLQRMNCYAEFVRRLTKGESANSVSRWASSLKVEGAARRWSFLYWRKHILALAKHVRRAKDKLRTRKPVLPQSEAVAAYVENQTLDLLDADVIPKSATQVSRHVDKALKEIDAERALKSACYRQIGCVERLTKLEEELQFLIPDGHKEINALRQLADSLHEIEVGKEWLRGKGGNMPYVALPQEASSDVEEGMREFDEVFRILSKEAGKRPR